MAVMSLLSLALALACADASARSCVLRCPERPASCTLCTSTGPLWPPSSTIFSDEALEDLHLSVLGASLVGLLGGSNLSYSIAVMPSTHVPGLYQKCNQFSPGGPPRGVRLGSFKRNAENASFYSLHALGGEVNLTLKGKKELYSAREKGNYPSKQPSKLSFPPRLPQDHDASMVYRLRQHASGSRESSRDVYSLSC